MTCRLPHCHYPRRKAYLGGEFSPMTCPLLASRISHGPARLRILLPKRCLLLLSMRQTQGMIWLLIWQNRPSGIPDLCWEMKIINRRSRFSWSFVCWSEVTIAEDTLNLKWFWWTRECSALRRQHFVLRGQRLCVNRSWVRVWLKPPDSGSSEYLFSCEWHRSSASR